MRQIGKSSLLARAAVAARKAGSRVVHLDFQLLEDNQLKDLDSLLRWLARRLDAELRPTLRPQEVWNPGDHLKRYVFGLSRDKALSQAFKSVLSSGACDDEAHFQRLCAVGLIRGSERGRVALRCQLYADYFRQHL